MNDLRAALVVALALAALPARADERPFDWDRNHARQDACLEANRIAAAGVARMPSLRCRLSGEPDIGRLCGGQRSKPTCPISLLLKLIVSHPALPR